MAEEYQVKAVYSADTSQFLAGTQTAINGMSNFANKASSSASNITKHVESIGKVTAVAGGAITAMGLKSIKSYGDFEASLNKAAVIAGGTSKDIQGLSDVANKMGADLPLSAKQAADAMVAMARDGASIDTIKQEFPAIARAATAAGADLQTTASVVQQSMNIWGKSLDGPNQAAAILTQTANLSNASIEDMQQALATIGGTASNAGVSMQDTSIAIGLLTNRGFSAAQASQDLNHAMLQMQAPSKIAAKQMSELGLTFTDAQGEMKPFPQILQEIADKMDGMSSSQKAEALKKMFGTAGVGAILPLLDSIKDKTGNTTTSWDAFSKAMDSAAKDGATSTKFLSDQATEMQKNLGSKIEQIGGNWESLRNKALASKSGVSNALVDMANNTLTWAQNSKSPIADVARSFVGLAPAIGPAVTAVGGFLTNFGKITSVVKGTVKVIGSAGKSFIALVGRLLGVASGNTAVASTSAPAAAGTKAVGSSAKTSAKEMMQLGLAILEMGAGIALATAGLALLVLSITQLAKQGTTGVIAVVAITVAIAALAAVFALLGPTLTASAAGLLAFSAVMLSIGASILMATAGIGMMTAGIGVMMFGIAAATNAVTNFILVMSSINLAATNFSQNMIIVGQGFAMMITSFVVTLMQQAPLIAQSFLQIFLTFLTTIVTYTPQIVAQFANIIIGFLNELTIKIPEIVLAITNLLLAMMQSIAANAPQLVAGFAAMIGKFAEALIEIMPYIIQLMGAIIAGMLAAIITYVSAFNQIGGVLLSALIAGITGKKFDAVGAATDVINSAGESASRNGVAAFKAAGGDSAISSLEAISNKKGAHQDAGGNLGKAAADGIKSKSDSAKNAGSSLGEYGANGVRSKKSAFDSAGSFIGSGILSGLESMGGPVMRMAAGIANSAANAIRSALKIHSPSRVTYAMGEFVGQGLINGMSAETSNVEKAATQYADVIKSQNYGADMVQDGKFDYQLNPITTGFDLSDTGTVSMKMEANKQSANINLNMGANTFNAFVDDISNNQGNRAELQRNNSVALF